MLEYVKKLLESAPVIILGAIIGAGMTYLSMVTYLGQFVDERIAASTRAGGALQIPKDTVWYFDEPKGCPLGWTDLAKAEPAIFSGRTLVASGSHEDRAPRTYRQTGGSETHRLSVDEMPPHEHGVISARQFLWLRPDAIVSAATAKDGQEFTLIKSFDPETDLEFCRDCGPDYRMTALQTDSAGGKVSGSKRVASAHNNMPPFVALFLCRKE